MLGSLSALLLSIQDEFEVSATYRDNLDVKNPPKNINWVRFNVIDSSIPVLRELLCGYDYVINAIGIIKHHNPDAYGVLSSSTYSINSVFPLILDHLSIECGYQLIQIGTDCVFDGNEGFYTETSNFSGIDDYGFSKIMSEQNMENSLLIRSSIFGPEFKNKLSLLEWFLNQPFRATLNGYTNHFWNGVSTYQFARVIGGHLSTDSDRKGVLHLVPEDAVSKYHLLCMFREVFHRQDIQIIPHQDAKSVNRILKTNNPDENLRLWNQAGYTTPPSINSMVEECFTNLKWYRQSFN